MAVDLVACLVLLSTIVSGEYTPSFIYHGRGNYGNVNLENEKADTPAEVTSKPAYEINKVDSRTFVIDQKEQTSNDTQNLQSKPINNITDISSTESSQKASQTEEMAASSSNVYVSYSPPPYEVHENVVDIPDDRTPAGPVVPYTRPPLINTVRPVNSTPSINNGNNPDEVTDANIKNKKNHLSILHINAEYEDKYNEIQSVNKVPGIFKGIKDYLSGLHRGFLNGIHKFFHKEDVHGKQKRSADYQQRGGDTRGRQSNKDVDKTEFYVRQRHISLT